MSTSSSSPSSGYPGSNARSTVERSELPKSSLHEKDRTIGYQLWDKEIYVHEVCTRRWQEVVRWSSRNLTLIVITSKKHCGWWRTLECRRNKSLELAITSQFKFNVQHTQCLSKNWTTCYNGYMVYTKKNEFSLCCSKRLSAGSWPQVLRFWGCRVQGLRTPTG